MQAFQKPRDENILKIRLKESKINLFELHSQLSIHPYCLASVMMILLSFDEFSYYRS
jgi:hypothetical protein